MIRHNLVSEQRGQIVTDILDALRTIEIRHHIAKIGNIGIKNNNLRIIQLINRPMAPPFRQIWI